MICARRLGDKTRAAAHKVSPVQSLFYSLLLFMLTHALVWFSTNAQFVPAFRNKAMALCLILAVPTSLASYYATRHGYAALSSVWSVRLVGFGLSYVMFPLLSWLLLKESPFEEKTLICIALSFLIVATQIWWPRG